MSEGPLPEEAQEIPLEKVQIFTPRMAAAVAEVMERKRKRLLPNYKFVGKKHGVSPAALRTSIWRFENGEASMGLPKSEEEMIADAQMELKRSFQMYDELERLLNNSLEVLIERAKKFQKQGKVLAYRDLGIPLVLADLRSLSSAKNVKNKGLLELMRAARKEREIKDAVANVPSEVVDSLSEEVRAQQALRRHLADVDTAVDAEIHESPEGSSPE